MIPCCVQLSTDILPNTRECFVFNFLKKKSAKPDQATTADTPQTLSSGLARTRSRLTEGLSQLLLGKKTIDKDLLNEIETSLLTADIGIQTTDSIIQTLTQQLARKQLADPSAVLPILKQILLDKLNACEQPLPPLEPPPTIIMLIGVNGAGKTTTIGKLAHQFQQQGKSVMLAAGDTFRAAAVEQLQTWGKRNQVPVIAQATGADSAAVAFDAVQAANEQHRDILLIDTAGRLHNKDHLMRELDKVKRVIRKTDPNAPHQTLLVLDASTGQNALQQALTFHQEIGVSGIILTKLDGTAKGGIIFAIADQLKLPVYYIGIGESVSDLKPFVASAFVDALFEDAG